MAHCAVSHVCHVTLCTEIGQSGINRARDVEQDGIDRPGVTQHQEYVQMGGIGARVITHTRPFTGRSLSRFP